MQRGVDQRNRDDRTGFVNLLLTSYSYFSWVSAGAGSDLQGIKTNAVKDGDDWILNGSKTFITNGYHSDLVIVVAR